MAEFESKKKKERKRSKGILVCINCLDMFYEVGIIISPVFLKHKN